MTFLDKFGGTVTNFDYLFLRSITKLGEAAGRCNVNWLEPQPLTMNSRHPLLFDLQVTNSIPSPVANSNINSSYFLHMNLYVILDFIFR